MSGGNLYIFDFDGTISYTGDDIAFSLNEVRRFYGLEPLDTAEVLKYVGYGAGFLIENTVSVPGVSGEVILSQYKKAYFDHCTDTSRPYEGLRETLEKLRARGDKAALFTNKPLDTTMKTLDFFGITGQFNSIFCPENLTNRKPHPEGILRCIEEAGCVKERTVMVGDSKADVDAGKAAGVRTCGCLYGMGDQEKLRSAGPDILINDIREVLNI